METTENISLQSSRREFSRTVLAALATLPWATVLAKPYLLGEESPSLFLDSGASTLFRKPPVRIVASDVDLTDKGPVKGKKAPSSAQANKQNASSSSSLRVRKLRLEADIKLKSLTQPLRHQRKSTHDGIVSICIGISDGTVYTIKRPFGKPDAECEATFYTNNDCTGRIGVVFDELQTLGSHEFKTAVKGFSLSNPNCHCPNHHHGEFVCCYSDIAGQEVVKCIKVVWSGDNEEKVVFDDDMKKFEWFEISLDNTCPNPEG